MAAVVRASIFTGATPTAASAEGGAKFGRDEALASTTPVPKPTATGTNYSFPKVYALEVTTADTTSLSNRRINATGALPAGVTFWYRDDGATYVHGNAAPASTATDDAAPTGYVALPTTATAYDTAVVTAALGRNGDYLSVVMGISNLYTAGANSNLDVPDVVLTYDEA